MADALPQQYAALSKPLATAKMFEARKDLVTVYWIRKVSKALDFFFEKTPVSKIGFDDKKGFIVYKKQ